MSIYKSIGLNKVINCSGKMTKLGVSTLHESVTDSMMKAGQDFVVIDELMTKAGQVISEYMKTEGTCVTASASSGIAISVASVIAGENLSKIEALPTSDTDKKNIIIQKGHAVNFGAPITSMIKVGGGVPVEVGHANKVEIDHIKEAIDENTAALFYVKSHHCVQKGMIGIDEMHKIAKEFDIPFIVDAAAEEDFHQYTTKNYDMVIFSGAKALEGPTSGFITGKKENIQACLAQYKGLARSMKIGKENIMGLLKSIENYFNKSQLEAVNEQKRKAQYLVDAFNTFDVLSAEVLQDEAGRDIYRAQVHVGKDSKLNALELSKKLKEGKTEIYVREHRLNIGQLGFDVRSVTDADLELVQNRMKEILDI